MLVSSAITRAVASPENESSSTDGRLMSTFAAAPRAAASASSVATSRSLEALALLRPTSDSELEAGLHGQERHLGRALRGQTQSGLPGKALAVGLPGQPHRGREIGIGIGILIREAEKPGREPKAD